MEKVRFIYALIICLILINCSSNFFDTTPAEVSSFSPSDATITSEMIPVVINFSKKMERSRVQVSFSLLEDSVTMEGVFGWSNDDKTMKFTPNKAYLMGRKYTIKLDDTAEDINGNNLKKSFSHTFSLSSDFSHPFVVTQSVSPLPNAYLNSAQMREPITVVFSKPIDKKYPQNNFSISPTIQGIFEWLDSSGAPISQFSSVNSVKLRFTPNEDYIKSQNYQVKILNSFTDLYQNQLREEYSFNFYTSDDFIKPSITSVQTDSTPAVTLLTSVNLNTGVEKDSTFIITFSKSMNRNDTQSAISVSPSQTLNFIWTSDTVLKVKPSDNLKWNNTYNLIISNSAKDYINNTLDQNYTYTFIINGKNSRPPNLQEIKWRKKGDLGFQAQNNILSLSKTNNNIYQFNSTGWVNLMYLEIALDFENFGDVTAGDININSLLSNFIISSINNKTTLTIKSYKRLINTDTDYDAAYQRFLFQVQLDLYVIDGINTLSLTGPGGIMDSNNNYMQGNVQVYLTTGL